MKQRLTPFINWGQQYVSLESFSKNGNGKCLNHEIDFWIDENSINLFREYSQVILTKEKRGIFKGVFRNPSLIHALMVPFSLGKIVCGDNWGGAIVFNARGYEKGLAIIPREVRDFSYFSNKRRYDEENGLVREDIVLGQREDLVEMVFLSYKQAVSKKDFLRGQKPLLLYQTSKT